MNLASRTLLQQLQAKRNIRGSLKLHQTPMIRNLDCSLRFYIWMSKSEKFVCNALFPVFFAWYHVDEYDNVSIFWCMELQFATVITSFVCLLCLNIVLSNMLFQHNFLCYFYLVWAISVLIKAQKALLVDPKTDVKPVEVTWKKQQKVS